MLNIADLVAHIASQSNPQASIGALVTGIADAHKGVQSSFDLQTLIKGLEANIGPITQAITFGTALMHPGAKPPVGVNVEPVVPVAPPGTPPGVHPIEAVQMSVLDDFNQVLAAFSALEQAIQDIAHKISSVFGSLPIPLVGGDAQLDGLKPGVRASYGSTIDPRTGKEVTLGRPSPAIPS